MKQAIKVLESRIRSLDKEWDKSNALLDECEMISEEEFLTNDLINIELEVKELQTAISILNEYVK